MMMMYSGVLSILFAVALLLRERAVVGFAPRSAFGISRSVVVGKETAVWTGLKLTEDGNLEYEDIVAAFGEKKAKNLLKKWRRQKNRGGVVLATAAESTTPASSQPEPAAEPSKALKLIISGAPASGKGTQCAIIKDTYGVIHLSTGDMLRAAVAAGTEVGVKAKEFMDSGKLVPDEVIIGIVKDRLEEDDCVNNGWLLDGFPRTEEQAKALADTGVKADCFIMLNVPDDVLIERVVGRRTDPETGAIYHMTFNPPPDDDEILARLQQRSDDTEEKARVRLEQFHANVEAVKGRYADITVEIDGTKPPAEVSETISSGISSMISV